MWTTQMRHIGLGQSGKIGNPEKKRLAGTEQKWSSTIKLCQRVDKGNLYIVGVCVWF